MNFVPADPRNYAPAHRAVSDIDSIVIHILDMGHQLLVLLVKVESQTYQNNHLGRDMYHLFVLHEFGHFM